MSSSVNGGGNCSSLLKENQQHTKTRHKLPHTHKVGAVVSPYLKTPKPTYQIRHTTPPYVRDCVSVCARVRVYMYIIPQIIISNSAMGLIYPPPFICNRFLWFHNILPPDTYFWPFRGRVFTMFIILTFIILLLISKTELKNSWSCVFTSEQYLPLIQSNWGSVFVSLSGSLVA